MQNAANFFNLLNNFVAFTLFAGLFLVATFSLISLSPISFEDYSAYKEGMSNYYAQQDSQGNEGQVAGVSDPQKFYEIEYVNLLETKQQQYKFGSNNDRSSAQLYLNLDPATLEGKDYDQLDLLEIKNNSSRSKKVRIIFQLPEDLRTNYSLISQNQNLVVSNGGDYTLEVTAYSSGYLTLLRTGTSEILEQSVSLTIQLSEDKSVTQVENTDGVFLERLP